MSETILNILIKLRRAEFLDTCVLAEGEPGYHTTQHVLKIGDGVHSWSELPAVNREANDLLYKKIQEGKEFTGSTIKTVTKVEQNANGEIDVTFEDIAFPTEKDTITTVAAGDGIDVTETIDDEENRTYEVAHANTSDVANVIAAERTYVKSLTFDDFGHVTAVETGTETVEDTNTAHTHINGVGTTVTSNGGIDGAVAVNLNVAFELVKEGDKVTKVVLYDKNDTEKNAIASFEAADFIKDGMLNDVSYDETTNKITFTWNTDAGSKTDSIELTDLLDPYTAGALIDIDGTVISHEKVAAPVETAGEGRKYLTSVTTDGYGHITGFTTATETDQDLSNFKIKQAAVEDPDADGKSLEFIDSISQNENGEIAVTKKSVDLSNYYNKTDADGKFVESVSIASPEEGKVQLTVDNVAQDAVEIQGFATLKAHAESDHVTSVAAGNDDIVVAPVDPNTKKGTGDVTISHKNYGTGTLTKNPANLTKTGDAYFFNSIELSNGHVTSGSMKSLAETLAGMTFILDGGTSAN